MLEQDIVHEVASVRANVSQCESEIELIAAVNSGTAFVILTIVLLTSS